MYLVTCLGPQRLGCLVSGVHGDSEGPLLLGIQVPCRSTGHRAGAGAAAWGGDEGEGGSCRPLSELPLHAVTLLTQCLSPEWGQAAGRPGCVGEVVLGSSPGARPAAGQA